MWKIIIEFIRKRSQKYNLSFLLAFCWKSCKYVRMRKVNSRNIDHLRDTN